MNKTSLFLDELKKRENKEKAIQSQLYHKSTREHWGVTIPECVDFTRAFTKEMSESELIQLAKELWETNLFDPMMCSAKILSYKKVKPSPKLWTFLVEFLKKVDGWALEDSLAHAAWKCILADESILDQLETWTKHSNFWMRRAALIYTLPYAKKGQNPERMLKWASSYARDPEWFIQKAIGWYLRDLGEHNPERVILFLQSHWDKLKSVAKKEATRKLSSHWKNQLVTSTSER